MLFHHETLLTSIKEHQTITTHKQIKLIGIVAFDVTLVWDNLCRNSCIRFSSPCFDVQKT